MISVNETLQILHENIPAPMTELISIESAHGRRLSDDIDAPESSPRYTKLAMDGFAVRWKDCSKASSEHPISLKMIGESQAGIPFENLITLNSAIRISAGAMLPEGADTIVLGVRQLALLAAVGEYKVPIYAPLKVALLVTGTELAPPDAIDIKSHQIRDSNSIM